MKNLISVFILALLCATTVFSQDKKEVLMTIDGKPVYASEFKRVYKKNLDLVQDDSKKDIDGYLDLFIDYKLKIAEAEAQGLDKEPEYKSEFLKYRDQLSRSYLYEDKITEDMAKEAFERSKEQINATHILIAVDYEAVPQDTLKAYNKIKSIREKALQGEDFKALAKKYSEEPGSKERGGELGYFTAFSMVYPFENAAYNTKVGEISNIIRTSFGYHILKVNDRRLAPPKIVVSHIMISDKKGARDFNPKERINEIATLIKQGESFESLAKQFSDDRNSAIHNGKLKPFSKGDLRSSDFETAAFALQNPGDISEPIKTDFGWHIIRLDEKLKPETFEQQRVKLEKKVGEGDRSKVVIHAVNQTIKDKYGFQEGESYSPFFETYLGDDILKRRWVMTPISKEQNKTLFTIGDKTITYSDFAKYIEERQRTARPYNTKETLLSDFYNEFETMALKNYFKERLEVEDENYAGILSEYRDGLLIFDVMEKNIWEKGKNDSIGLQEYYNKTKENYQWKQRIDADIYAATSQMSAQQIQKMLAEGKSSDEIKATLNADDKVNVLITRGVFEVDQEELPKNLKIKDGTSDIYPSNDSFVVVNIKEIIAPGVKALDDVKGRVLSNYQNDIEKSWMHNLHSKYKVEINKKTLKRVKKELK
ncbi:peptidylprolyl isomerase [Aequorivita capsosiphonis]|uniref:peptidylprolyl isomerase n=1 Tax=Aequorivita capsosiphonis TaxID=487317 RepID=UPI000478D403|nr:peptidylprolyl isomerase [Aequorivita capsosiphonis]